MGVCRECHCISVSARDCLHELSRCQLLKGDQGEELSLDAMRNLTHTCTHTQARTHTRTHAHTHTYTHTHTETLTHARTNTHTGARAHTHTNKQTNKNQTPKQHNKTARPKADKYPTSHFLHLTFHRFTVVWVLFCSLKSALTPKIRMLSFTLINSALLNL